jgi:hypothetical protein
MSLFTPTILLFLALLLLVSGLLLFYMEMKMREQNHKIKAIADLATTIAHSIKGGNATNYDNRNSQKETNIKELSRENIQLIQVSDDEIDCDEDTDSDNSSSSDDDHDDRDDDDDEDDEDDEDDAEDKGEEQEQQKEPMKLNINMHDTESDIKHVFLSQEQLNEANEEPVEVLPVEAEASVLEVHLSSQSEVETDLDTFKIVLSSELDYKKMNIQKLRQLVSEKGLAPSSETSKMKKPELLKLLEAE